MPSYKLTYFDGTARGECPRLLLTLAGQKFEDKRIKYEDWPAFKSKTPFGTVPILEVTNDDGTKLELAQSQAICRYLARKFNLHGKTLEEQALVEMYMEQINDANLSFFEFAFEQDPKVKEEKNAKFMSETLPQTLGYIESQILSKKSLGLSRLGDKYKNKGAKKSDGEHPKSSKDLGTKIQSGITNFFANFDSKLKALKTDFMIGENLTVVDLYLYVSLSFMQLMGIKVDLSNYPLTKACFEQVKSQPEIVAWNKAHNQ